MVSRLSITVALCLSLLACSGPGGEPDAEPAADAPTVEEYATASQEACDEYLGAMFEMAQEDDELDTAAEDASTELFLRRAEDIAELYAGYRSTVDSLAVPEDDDVRATHDEVVQLMGENVETIEAVGEAHEQGDDEQALALMEESSRIEDEIAAAQAANRIRPCG